MSIGSFTKKELIIIDDDKATVSYNVKLTEQVDCFSKIHTFTSAECALDFLSEQTKQNTLFNGAIILDVYMGDLDGFEFLDEIEDLELVNPSIKVLVLTVENSARSREKTAISSLKTNFELKPLTEAHLLNLANTYG